MAFVIQALAIAGAILFQEPTIGGLTQKIVVYAGLAAGLVVSCVLIMSVVIFIMWAWDNIGTSGHGGHEPYEDMGRKEQRQKFGRIR